MSEEYGAWKECLDSGVVESGLWNYYGEVLVFQSNGLYYLGLADHSSDGKVQISEEFYNAFVKEFRKEG